MLRRTAASLALPFAVVATLAIAATPGCSIYRNRKLKAALVGRVEALDAAVNAVNVAEAVLRSKDIGSRDDATASSTLWSATAH
ncbi:MAG: hypothetical protein ACHREM_11000 [Polyangiales bacterium]